MFGPMRRQWRRQYNYELDQLFKETPISEYVRMQILRWTGYVVRMEENGLPKKGS